jgi:hypothetical protein
MNPPPVPPFFVVTERPRRSTRSTLSRVFSFVSSLAVVGLICFGVYLGITTNKPFKQGADGRAPGLVNAPPEAPRPIMPPSGGNPPEPIQPVVHNPMPGAGSGGVQTASPNDPKAEKIARADALVHAALKAAKQGMFVKANDLADEARRVCPDHPAATGAWYLAAYAKEYPALADEARERISGDNVDLGPKFGRAAFVEREGDTYKFRWEGGKLELTITELDAMDGVRFSITRQFLGNADFTANHLILAAVHHLKNIDETGGGNVEAPEKCLAAAVDRCKQAAGQDDAAAEHAKHMIALFAWLEAQPAANDVADEG